MKGDMNFVRELLLVSEKAQSPVALEKGTVWGLSSKRRLYPT
jgi:hypothetical protein